MAYRDNGKENGDDNIGLRFRVVLRLRRECMGNQAALRQHYLAQRF